MILPLTRQYGRMTNWQSRHRYVVFPQKSAAQKPHPPCPVGARAFCAGLPSCLLSMERLLVRASPILSLLALFAAHMTPLEITSVLPLSGERPPTS